MTAVSLRITFCVRCRGVERAGSVAGGSVFIGEPHGRIARGLIRAQARDDHGDGEAIKAEVIEEIGRRANRFIACMISAKCLRHRTSDRFENEAFCFG